MSEQRFMILDQRGIDIYDNLTKEQAKRKLKELGGWRNVRVKPHKDWTAPGQSREEFLEKA